MINFLRLLPGSRPAENEKLCRDESFYKGRHKGSLNLIWSRRRNAISYSLSIAHDGVEKPRRLFCARIGVMTVRESNWFGNDKAQAWIFVSPELVI